MGRQSERRRKGRGERGPQGGRGPPAAGLNRLRPLSARPPRPCSAFSARRSGESRGRGGRKAPPLRAAPRAALAGAVSAEAARGSRGQERGARRSPRGPPPRPPARRAPGGRSERFQMWRRRAGPGARRGAHGAGRAAPTRAQLEPPLAPPPAPRPACRPDTPLAPRPGPRVLRGPLSGEASGAQLQEEGPSAHLESLRIGPLREAAKGAAAPRRCLVDYDQGGCTSGVDAERRGQRERAREAEPPGEALVPRCLSRLIDPGFLNSSEAAEHVCYQDMLTFSS